MPRHITMAKAVPLRLTGGLYQAAASSRPALRFRSPGPLVASLTTRAADPPPSAPGGMPGTADGPSTADTTPEVTGTANTSQTATDQLEDEFWRKTPVWADTPAKDFLSYRWGVGPISQTTLS